MLRIIVIVYLVFLLIHKFYCISKIEQKWPEFDDTLGIIEKIPKPFRNVFIKFIPLADFIFKLCLAVYAIECSSSLIDRNIYHITFTASIAFVFLKICFFSFSLHFKKQKEERKSDTEKEKQLYYRFSYLAILYYFEVLLVVVISVANTIFVDLA